MSQTLEHDAAKRASSAGAYAAPLMHWLALLSGLAALTVVRVDDPMTVAPLWLGGVLGTALGQLLALRRARLWVMIFALLNAIFFGTLLGTPLWMGTAMRMSQDDVVLAFVPAALCAYVGLRERITLGGFWFPAVPWTLAMIESAGGLPEDAIQRWGVVAGPAVLLVGYLYTHEARRVSIWRSSGLRPLANAEPAVVLRDSPARSIGRVVLGGVTTAMVLAITAWIAPHLWQKETTLRSEALAARADPACCPETTTPATHLREYFTPVRGREGARRAPPGCAVCQGGVPVEPRHAGDPAPTTGGADPTKPGDIVVNDVKVPSEIANPTAEEHPRTPPPTASTVTHRPDTAPVAGGPTAPEEPAREARLAGLPLRGVTTGTRVRAGRLGARRGAVIGIPADSQDTRVLWLGVLVFSVALTHMGIRPLRRRLALRHLRHPLWPETPDQRISNLWQLLLVGLRDAGFRAAPGEPPLALARRAAESTAAPVAKELTTCATVLERARHGVRLDAGDLEHMERAATSIYEAARRPLAWPVRAAATFRWPLV